MNKAETISYISNIKLIVTDLDGTLLHSDGSLSENTILYLYDFQKNGGYVMLATSRHMYECVDIAEKVLLPNYGFIATSNGMYVYDSVGTLLNEFCGLSSEDFISIVGSYKKNRITAVTDGVDFVYSAQNSFLEFLKCCILNIRNKSQKRYFISYNSISNSSLKIEKIMVDGCLDGNNCEYIHKKYNLVCDGRRHFEIQNKTTDKFTAIKWLASQLSLQLFQIIAFGDDINDVNMLKGLRNSVAMSNANQEVKLCAQNITLTNNEDGVFIYLKEHVIRETI